MVAKKNSSLKQKLWWSISIIAFIVGVFYSQNVEYPLHDTDTIGMFAHVLNFLGSFCGGIIYFFVVGALSHIIIYRSIRKDWIVGTFAFYLISIILGLFMLNTESEGWFLILFFPLYNAPYLIAYAILTINEHLIKVTYTWIQLIAHLLVIFSFAYWGYLEFFCKKLNKNLHLVKRILLIFIFLMLVLGVHGCMSAI